jgi:hypothetical protein
MLMIKYYNDTMVRVSIPIFPSYSLNCLILLIQTYLLSLTRIKCLLYSTDESNRSRSIYILQDINEKYTPPNYYINVSKIFQKREKCMLRFPAVFHLHAFLTVYDAPASLNDIPIEAMNACWQQWLCQRY